MLDMTLGAILSHCLQILVELAPAIIGSGVYLFLGPEKFDGGVKSLGNFVFSVIIGYSFGQLMAECYDKVKHSFWLMAWIQAIASVFLVEVLRRGYTKIDAVWERVLNIIPSFDQIRDLFKARGDK